MLYPLSYWSFIRLPSLYQTGGGAQARPSRAGISAEIAT